MADKKISQLTAYTPPIDTDIFPVVDITTPETKKITWANVKLALDNITYTILTFSTRIITPEIKAGSSAGIDLHNNAGTQVAIFGAGGTTGSTLVGTTNIGSASADYTQISGGTGSATRTATGSSTNIDLIDVPKGSGRHQTTGGAYITGALDLGHTSDTTITRSAAGVLAVEGVAIPSISSTSTLTNKRITKRVLALSAGSATPAINTDSYDVVHITAQSAAITSFTTNLTGTPVDGDTLRISITDNGTARALTWGSSFEASAGNPLPTTTTISTRLDVGFFWNTETSKWRCVAST